MIDCLVPSYILLVKLGDYFLISIRICITDKKKFKGFVQVTPSVTLINVTLVNIFLLDANF